MLYTIIETARLNGLNPEACLTDVIDRLAKGHLRAKLDELLPWNYAKALACESACNFGFFGIFGDGWNGPI